MYHVNSSECARRAPLHEHSNQFDSPRRDAWASLRAAGRDVAAMSRARRDAARGARALAPAVEDAPVRSARRRAVERFERGRGARATAR